MGGGFYAAGLKIYRHVRGIFNVETSMQCMVMAFQMGKNEHTLYGIQS